LSGIEQIIRSQPHQSTQLGQAIMLLSGGTADYSLRSMRGQQIAPIFIVFMFHKQAALVAH
jgi:hypothetical protein